MKDNIKVCFLINSLLTGGAERTVCYLANEYVRQGIPVDIVIYGDRGIYPLDDRVNLFVLAKKKKNNIFSKVNTLVKRIKDFKKYEKENAPDVIFCMLYPALIYTLFSKKPIILSERSNPNNFSFRKRCIIKSFFKKADGLVFQTRRAQSCYSKKLTNKSVVIPNAVGNPDAYNIKYDGIRRKAIVAIGSLKKEKDYNTLIDAFNIVHNKHSEYCLEIYGKGALKDELEQKVSSLNLKEVVIFKGVKNDVLNHVKDASCYVLSSISEGMPNSLMEAMAIGLPCVSTDCTYGPAELINNNENGILVPIKNPNLMADAICKMIEDNDFSVKCSTNAKKILETNSVENISKAYYSYIKEVANAKKR